MFDRPHKMLWGIYTFVYHPSKMNSIDFVYLENFLSNNSNYLTSVSQILDRKFKHQSIIGKFFEYSLHLKRKVLPYEEFAK